MYNTLNVYWLSVPASPRSVAIETAGVNSLSLSWQPPHPTYGIVIGYSVGYSIVTGGQAVSGDVQPTSDNDMTLVTVDQPFSLHFNVTGLRPFTDYRFQVFVIA